VDGPERGQGAGVASGEAAGEQPDGVEHIAGEPHGSPSLAAPLEAAGGRGGIGGRRGAERRRRRRLEVTWEAAGCIGTDSSIDRWGQNSAVRRPVRLGGWSELIRISLELTHMDAEHLRLVFGAVRGRRTQAGVARHSRKSF
jgi:hypothetical protein